MIAQTVAVVENEPRPLPLMAGSRPSAIVPQSMEEAYRIAVAVCRAGMAPKGLDTPEKALVAIMHGLEVGLTPMAALQRIAVVNGRPTIWGDGAIGLVRGSGACEFIHESLNGEGDAMTATCETKRKGEVEPIVGKFSAADARTAGLWGKQGPWQQFPKRMLQMRARAFALRDAFADVLGGLYLREEIEDDGPRKPPAPTVAAIENKPAVIIEPLAGKPKPVEVTGGPQQTIPAATQRRPPAPPSARSMPISPAIDFAAHKARTVEALALAKDFDACDHVFARFAQNRKADLTDAQYEELREFPQTNVE